MATEIGTLGLFNDQLDGLTGSVARIVAYQFSVVCPNILFLWHRLKASANRLL